MAGDWIKMRGNLWDDPRVTRLCDLTDSGEAAVIGALYWLWATADQHTEDGSLPGLTLRQIDRKTGVPGFGAALVSIGWLSADEAGCAVAHFEEHNGASAKKRCQTAKRVAAFKAGNAQEPPQDEEGNAGSVSEALALRDLEKRREEEEKNQCTHTPLARDWKLPKAWGDEAMAENPHWTPDAVRSIAAQFADHWRASGGSSADWAATWRKWCRDDLTQKAHPIPKPAVAKPAAQSITVPCTDTRAEKHAADMEARKSDATLPPWAKKVAA